MFDLLSLRRVLPALVAVFAFFSACAILQADELVDEIVVTADFRERSAAELPSSITVLDAEQVEQRAVQHFEELVLSVPNLNWSGDGHRARYFQIRGVGELEQYEGAPNPSVGFLIDDIDFSGIGGIATLFDVQQVEVLRGPQGSRYGANALAGLIYVKSAEPTKDWNGRVHLGGAEDNAISAGAAVGGPLTADENLTFRLSAHRHESDGFRDNPYLGRGDTNAREETGARAKLLWDAGTDWQLQLTAMWTDIDDGYDAFAIDNSLTVLSDRPGRDAQRSTGSAFKAVWSGHERFEVTSITTAASSDIEFGFDADWGNEQSWAPFTYDFISVNDRKRRTLGQEFRVASTGDGRLFADSTDWLAGMYVLQLDDRLATLNEGLYEDPIDGFTDALDDRFSSRFEALNVALFGQLNVDVGLAGELGFGLRAERRTTDYADSAGLMLGPGETMLGGELSYTHSFADGLAAFASLSRGYKAGGFNLGPIPDGGRKFAQESLWNIEAGIKALWLDDALHFNGSVFYNRRQDQQVRTSAQLNPNDPASFVFFTDNAAEGDTVGLEAEVRWLPSESWEFYSSIGLLYAEFEWVGGTSNARAGRDQAHAPNYSIAAGGLYRHRTGLFARVDAHARDEFYFDVSHDQRSKRQEIVNARAGFETERWTAQFWIRNVFDEAYAVRGFYFGNEPPDFPDTLYIRQGDPRQLGVTFDMRF
ncbi:MAG TPA: TonB-dependent receptor plug domain-containing protein [Woeseiaceae bacterium]|nr:TonB-dependent receptor plug domain-containing protein [Woeseiaceae bacterium]